MKTGKKVLLSAGVILVFVAYTFQQRHDTSSPVIAPSSTAAGSSSSQTSQSGQTTTATTATKYKDGTYVGDTEDAFYGNIQVQATIQNGKITDVQFLQYPNDRANSIAINSQAMPYLRQEAIQAQTANVNTITGATDTSQAFVQSLATALQQAQLN